MKGTTEIQLAKVFSRFPAGRFYSDGPASGQRFREEYLLPALRDFENVEINLDGTPGYGSSFLEEAFGGLVREHGFSAIELRRRLRFHVRDETLVQELWEYISEAGS